MPARKKPLNPVRQIPVVDVASDPLISVKDIARLTGFKMDKAYQIAHYLISMGRAARYGKLIRIRRSELMRYIAEKEVGLHSELRRA